MIQAIPILTMALGATVFTEDVTFLPGDDYWSVEIRADAHAEVLGGTFGNSFRLYDTATADFMAGDVRGVLSLYGDSSMDFHAGRINTYLTATDRARVDLYGGVMPDAYMELTGDSLATFHALELSLDPTGGSLDEGLVDGRWPDRSRFAVDLRGEGTAGRIRFVEAADVPEPSVWDMVWTVLLFIVVAYAVGIVVGRYERDE